MIELPEARVLAQQLNETVRGKTVRSVAANASPHKLAWFLGDPDGYAELLTGKRIGSAEAQGGNVELCLQEERLVFQDGAPSRFFAPGEALPGRHQLLLELEDGSFFAVTVRMYGGILAFHEGENDNPYYLIAKEKRSPLDDTFDEAYFRSLCECENYEKLSAKAFLATQQRIPGLGNGVLQDILWHAKLHPKQKMGSVGEEELERLFHALKTTLYEMFLKGGRASEKDLFGCPGGYVGILQKNTAGTPCPACGSIIEKQAYLGGSIYFCPECQPLCP